MSYNLGTGVSRVLDPDQAQIVQVVWQEGKPPLDSELNMMQQLAENWRRINVLRGTPSGWLGNVTNSKEAFVTSSVWSNWFRFGQQRTGAKGAIEWAVVNGWLVPVTGTKTGSPPGSPDDSSTWNRVTLDPPPANSGDSRIDFVFLEVWLARVPPNPSSDNKPSSSGLWRYGNVEGGYSFLSDDIQDPAIGFETTQRVQLQYRIRVVSGLVGLASYPDGFDPTLVKARGAATTDTAYTFTNMRQELGDPGLWRAGDGTSNSLGTVDGYSYAVPLAAVFRRNSVAWDGDPGQNLNGSRNRNPTAVDRTGYKTFSTTPTLAADLDDSTLSLSLVSASNIPLPLTPASAVLIQIDDEILQYSVITGTTMTLTERGSLGSRPETHLAGAEVKILAGRPDGLFADQIAKTDILDLRHVVNPNGFDYDSLLQSSLDKLMRGNLQANWKRSGGGPQGPFVFYQDKISNSAAALGVTKLDGPDNQRMIFSDAAAQQPIELILEPPTGQAVAEPVTVSWDLSLSATVDNTGGGGAAGSFNPTDVISIPVAQLKTGILGGDADQIRWMGSDDEGSPSLGLAVQVRIDGEPEFLIPGVHYSITAAPTPTDPLQITLLADFPTVTDTNLYVTAHVLYGPGRGLSRRPDSLHSVSFLSSGSDIMAQLTGVPANNIPMQVAWAPLWSKFRSAPLGGLLPATAEAYVDPGSRSVILTPFRRIGLPTTVQALDGANVNVNTGDEVTSGTTGDTTAGAATFSDAGATFITDSVSIGDALVVTAPFMGTFFVQSVDAETDLTMDRDFPQTVAGTVEYTIYTTQGLMPLNDLSNTAKWTTTDPLDLFSGTTQGDTERKNIFMPLPRSLVPGWGEVRLPIIHSDPTSEHSGGGNTFDEGVNFMILTKKGAAPGVEESNYVERALFTTYDFVGMAPSTFNTALSFSGDDFAGMRFFSDTRGLGREGLELPPFYGIARLFAVYEATDFETEGSSYDTSMEFQAGGATNLLRQDFDGPVFWIEIDEDGDSTFILNAEAIDITRSPNTIASFTAGNYVIEASIFGFDRGAFDLAQGPRIVLARDRDPGQANSGTRANNFGTVGTAALTSPALVIPGPALSSDEVAINYSRSPYQGDAWGSQTVQQDTGYKPGVLTTGSRFQIQSTNLDEQNLTRPNQKPLEVLASVGFSTTLGSGRFAGDSLFDARFDFRTVGWEQLTGNLPTSGADPRPPILIGAIESAEDGLPVGTEYHGCTDRLPLGSLLRDKDFRGNYISGTTNPGPLQVHLAYQKDRAPGTIAPGVAQGSSLEQTEIPVQTVSLASGQPGEVVVHVDGEQGNYGLLTNYRTNRGGSVFTASAPRPGGEVSSVLHQAGSQQTEANVLSGVAMLVRNAPTSVGATEVSAGSELMMLIVTTGSRLDDTNSKPLQVLCGTNGTAEGFSAADLYRIEGRPLVSDHTRLEVDPSEISLSKAFPFLG